MTGNRRHSELSKSNNSPSVFSKLWSGIDLPALWFWFVAVFLKLGGTSLAMLRLPSALFGALRLSRFMHCYAEHGAIRGDSWKHDHGFSVSNVHYSRLALNNIVTAVSGPLVSFSCCARCGRVAI